MCGYICLDFLICQLSLEYIYAQHLEYMILLCIPYKFYIYIYVYFYNDGIMIMMILLLLYMYIAYLWSANLKKIKVPAAVL